MLFKLLMLVHLCVAFPLKCPEPAQWAQRANSHCADPSKYFCLKNDLINGYSENCTRSDFQQPGRKAVLRGGIDAEICSVERYQPFPIKFYTNGSTNCLFLKSFCNEEGQVVYDHGNRNTDTTCRCDYRRGYDFLVKPNNPCFCKASREDCSCYLKTCSNGSDILSPDYNCIYTTDLDMVINCRPISDENGSSIKRPEINVNIPKEDTKSVMDVLEPWEKRSAIAVLSLFGGLIAFLIVLFRRYCTRVFIFISEPPSNITLYEGESFKLDYFTRKRRDFHIYKDGVDIKKRLKSETNVLIEDGGSYFADSDGVRSKYTLLTVLPLDIKGTNGDLLLIEGNAFQLKYFLPTKRFRLIFLKNNIPIAEQKGLKTNIFNISKVKPEDKGDYCAIVENVRSKITKLTIQSMFTSNFEPIYCIEGEKLNLKCTVYSEDIYVEWFRNNEERFKANKKIITNENISIGRDGRQHFMTVQCAKVTDSGQYNVVAANVEKQFSVFVKVMFKRPLENKTIMEGVDVSFECEVEKADHVAWFKDGDRVYPSSRLKIETLDNTVHKLTILQSKFEDEGKYSMRISDISSCAELDVKEMPDAVKQMSEYDRNIFLEAAKSGTAVRYYIRVMIVGQSGVGKTSLLRRQMNKDIKDVQSTDGINIEVKTCRINLKTEEWIFSSDFSKTPNHNEQYADCGFWDFAGQEDFYATHQTFLSTNAIYLLVVDISQDFTKKSYQDMIENEYDRIGEYVDFWLDNIHCYTLNDRNEDSINTAEFLNPPVLIIGTGIDKILEEKDRRKKIDSFHAILRNHPKRKHNRHSYFLSNHEPFEYKTEFENIRTQILKLAAEIPKWGDNLPTRWIILEKEIDSQIDKGNLIISYEEAMKLAEDCSFPIKVIDSELKSFLTYEHEIGNLIFFDDIRSFIVVEPKWLVNIFRCFVSPFQFQSDFLNELEWSELQLTGILRDSLITKLFKKVPNLDTAKHSQFALQIMEKFDIIVKPLITTSEEGNGEYYIPCMIKASKCEGVLDNFKVGSKTCSKSSWFILKFNFLPPSFFNHILVSFVKKYILCKDKNDRLQLYRSMGVFNLKNNGCEKLIVCLSENSVAMQIWQYHDEELQICDTNHIHIRTNLIDTVDLLQQRYKIKIYYKCYLKCGEGTYQTETGRIHCDETGGKFHCHDHGAPHSLEELRRYWFEVTKEIETHQKDNTAVKCHYCEKTPVYRCYECSNVLCNDCCINHDKLTDTKYHTFQSTNDKMLLNNKFEFSNKISDMKALPGGLLVIALFGRDKLLTYSVSHDKQRNEISIGGRTCGIAILDRNTVVVMLTHIVINSIAIVDIRQRQVIQHVDLTFDLPSYSYIPMFYTDDQLYISSQSGITVMDMSGTVDREIDLGLRLTDMCYDTKAARIYCIDYSGENLICIDRDGNTIFTFTDTGLTNAKRLTIDNEGYVLILCNEYSSVKNFTVYRISPDGKSGEVIITGKPNNTFTGHFSSICFQEESDEVVIGIDETVYTYKKK